MKRLFGAMALLCFSALSLLAQSAGVMPQPEQQFFDANGLPLAGGYIYTCVAGTSCPGNPQAAYTDATGTVALPNPVPLDSGGRASIWLGPSAYKIVAEDATGVVEWTADNVQIPGLSLLAGTGSLASLTVTGNTTIGGTLSVTGATTLASTLSAAATTLASLTVTGNETVGGTFGVTGAATLHNTTVSGTLGVTGAATLSGGASVTNGLSADTFTIGGVSLTSFVNALIASGGSPGSLAGTVAISDISLFSSPNNGAWVIFTFGTVSGTRVRIAIGSGNVGNGVSIAEPTGFNSTNLIATAAIAHVATGGDNEFNNYDCSVSGGVVSVSASDNSGHTYTPTANWIALAWITGY